MHLKEKFSAFLAGLLFFSPMTLLAKEQIPMDASLVPELKSLANLDTLEVDGKLLERGKDYRADVELSQDKTSAAVCFTFTNDYSGTVIKQKRIGDVEGFADVAADYYAHDPINYACDLGWVKGREDGLFHPTDSLSRGDLVTILWRMSGQPEESSSMNFADLDINNPVYFTKPALWASKHGIVRGYTAADGTVTFRGEQPISRQELAVMLHRYYGEDRANADLSGFVDANLVGTPYLAAMQWCVEHGIISGSPTEQGQVLNPAGASTRAATATMLQRFFKL